MKNKSILLVTLFICTFFIGCANTTKHKGELLTDTVTDIDGNVYHKVKIGTQIWMIEDLKTTKYRNGDSITNIVLDKLWSNLTKGAYCNIMDHGNKTTDLGTLYNWYAVNDVRNIAPKGWHVPTDVEWKILIDYLGGQDIAGWELKESAKYMTKV